MRASLGLQLDLRRAIIQAAPPASGLATFLGIAEPDSVVGTTYTWSGKTLAASGTQRIWLALVSLKSTAFSGTGAPTIAGTAATFVESHTSGTSRVLWYRRDLSNTTGDIVFNRGETYDKGIVAVWWRTETTVTNGAATGAAGGANATFSLNANVLNGDHVIAVGGGYTAATGTIDLTSLTGLTEVAGSHIDTLAGTPGEGAVIWAGEHVVTADETPRVMGGEVSAAYQTSAHEGLILR